MKIFANAVVTRKFRKNLDLAHKPAVRYLILVILTDLQHSQSIQTELLMILASTRAWVAACRVTGEMRSVERLKPSKINI